MMRPDLVKRLRDSELFVAALVDLDDSQRSMVSSIVESMLKDLEDVIEESTEQPQVLSTEG